MLLTLPILGLPLLGTAALAADPVVLPGAPLVAGEPGVVELWAPELSAEARIRGRSDRGRSGVAIATGDGRWLLPLTPDGTVEDTVTVFVSIKDGELRDDHSLSVPVGPAVQGALRLTAPAGGVVLGQDGSLDLHIEPLGTSHQPPQRRHLLLRSTLGSLGDPQLDGSGGWTVRWTAPRSLDQASYVLIAVADAAAPTEVLGWTAVPISRPSSVRLEVEPGAECALEAGEVLAATGKADGKGHLDLDLVLHPSLSRGILHCGQGDGQVERAVPLPAGQDPWLGWLPLPPQLPTGATVPLQLVVIEDDGSPRRAGSAPQLSLSVGSAPELELVADGLYSASWTVPDQPGPLTLRAELHGRIDSQQLDLVEPGTPSQLPPVRVVAWTEPHVVEPGTPSTVVLASAVDALGLPIARATFDFEPVDASLEARKLVAGRDGRAAVRLYLDTDAAWPGLELSLDGATDTALVHVGSVDPSPIAGSGSDQQRDLRQALAAGTPFRPTLRPAGSAVARAAAGEAVAVRAVEAGRSHSDSTRPWLRLAGSLGTVPHAYHQSAVVGDAGLPAEIDSEQGDLFGGDPLGPLAVDLRMQLQPPSLPVGLDLRATGRQEHYTAVGTSHERLDLQLAGGVRGQVPVSPELEPFVLAQVEAFRVPLFSYDSFREDDPSKATGSTMITTTVIGGRLGGGVDVHFGDLLLDLEATETFAPWPIHTRFAAAVEYPLIPEMALRAGLDLGFRSMEFDLGADQAQVTDQQHMLSLGLVAMLR